MPHSPSGRRDSVYGMTNCFPDTCRAVTLKRRKRINRRWHRKGLRFKSFVLISCTSGLWYVIKINDSIPVKYLSNFSQALTPAKHFFSICAYFFSASERVRDANAIGLSLALPNAKWHSDPWPVTVISQPIRLSTNFMTLIPCLIFTELRVVSMEHLQRVWLASRERLPFRTPGSVPPPLWEIAYSPIVETSFTELAVSFLDFSPWIPLGTFSILLQFSRDILVQCRMDIITAGICADDGRSRRVVKG